MRPLAPLCAALAALLLFAAACSDDAAPAGDGGPAVDLGPAPDAAPPTSLKVAALQYSSWDYPLVDGCFDSICGVTHYVREAAAAGARLIVTPENVFIQKSAGEPAPAVGDTPATDPRWAAGSIVKTFSALCAELGVTLVINLKLSDGGKLYNASLALDAGGKVVARHYKFELFGSDIGLVTAGTSVAQSFFDTPAGKAGLLICADAQCVVAGMQPMANCQASSVKLLQDYFAQKPALVLFSALWTVGPENPTWAALTIQKKVAAEGKVWLVAANTTKGNGRGGGIWKPDGTALKTENGITPTLVYAELPLKP